jgi:pteridine reductase
VTTALVTGAARRVGAATVLELASVGFDVAIHYNGSDSEAEHVAERARAYGVDAWTIQADLSDRTQIASLVERVQARWKTLDLLVNNASLFSPTPFTQIDDLAWDTMLGVNLSAPFFLCRDLMPQLLGSQMKGGALVVHMGDIGAERPLSGYAHYSVSKAGLVMLMRAMAVELGPQVRSVAVCPGHVAWPEGWSEAMRSRLSARVPLERIGEPEDVARLIRFLAVEGYYLNGDTINVDGGLSARY